MDGAKDLLDEQKLISSAKEDYLSGKFNECKSILNTLAAARPNDWKVSLNRILVDYLGSDGKDLQDLHDKITALCIQMNVNIMESLRPENVEQCILYYNQSIVLFRQKNYHDALAVVNKIFPMVHEMEGNLGRKVCVLLLDLNLHLKEFDKAYSNLLMIEKQYNMPNTIPVLGDQKSKVSGAPANSLHIQQFRMVLLEYKARIQLALSDYEACKETIDTLLSSGCLNYATSMIKAKLCVAMKRYDEALEVLYLFMQGIDDFVELPIENKMIFYNNLSIVNHLLRKSQACTFFMKKSMLIFNEGVTKNQDSDRKYFTAQMLLNLIYNRGVSLLFKGEPDRAFDCLLEVSQKLFRSSLLWLRLAECCIRINKSGNQEAFNLAEKSKELVKGVCKNKNNSSIMLNRNIYLDTNYNSDTQSYAVPTPTMEFGSICGRNALLLLPKNAGKLRLGVLAANAYIRLSIGDPVMTLKYAMALFQESNGSPVYKYLSRLYMSEAYLDLNQLDKAIQTLDPTTHKECDPMGDNPGPDFLPNSPCAGQSVLLYNLAVALAIRKELDKASELLKHVWISRGTDGQVPVHVLSLALYIELVQGRVDVAKTIIKQNCPHMFH